MWRHNRRERQNLSSSIMFDLAHHLTRPSYPKPNTPLELPIRQGVLTGLFGIRLAPTLYGELSDTPVTDERLVSMP